jgi:hypothetical protein
MRWAELPGGIVHAPAQRQDGVSRCGGGRIGQRWRGPRATSALRRFVGREHAVALAPQTASAAAAPARLHQRDREHNEDDASH